MAITYSIDTVDSVAASATTVSNSLTITSTSVITALYVIEDNATAGTLTISNSGTALTWNVIAVTNTTSNCKVAGWWAFGDANGNRTITVTKATNDALNRRLSCIVHQGADQTTPIPSGNIVSGASTTDVSQSITPSAPGSVLWMLCGDWNATNTFAARTNCTLEWTRNVASTYSATLIRPTTQPLSSGSAFTIGETDTSGTIAYIAFEVRAPAGGGSGVALTGAATLRSRANGAPGVTAPPPPSSDISHVWSSEFAGGLESFSGSGLQAGDTLFIFCSLTHLSADQGVLTPPTGFTRLGGVIGDAFGEKQRLEVLYKKTATGSETSVPVDTTAWDPTGAISICSVYRGVDQTSPIEASNSSDDWQLPSLSLAGTRDLLIGVFATKGGSGPYTFPATMTQRAQNLGSVSNDPTIWVGDRQLTASGATGTGYVGTLSVGGSATADYVIALKPAAPLFTGAGKATIAAKAKAAGTARTALAAKVAFGARSRATALVPLSLAAKAGIRTRAASGTVISYILLAIQTRFSPSMRGTINGAVGLSTSAAATTKFGMSGETTRQAGLVAKATSAAQAVGAVAGGTLLSGLATVTSLAKSTFSGRIILAIQTRISPAMRGALNSAVLPTAVALAAAAAVISRAKAAIAGQTSLSAQTTSTIRASSGLKAVAYVAGKTAAQTRAVASAVLRSSLVAIGALRSAARGAMGGTLPLLGRTAVAVASRAGLPIAVALAARALAALKGMSAPSASTAITGRSTLRNGASAQVRLTTLIAALARVSSAARATSSAAVALSTAARATLAFQARAAFSGVVSLGARVKTSTVARIGQGFSSLRANAAVRTSARALLFVLRPVIPTPVYPRPGRLGRLRASLEKAFGEEFDINPMTAGVDPNSRVLPDISRDALIDVIGIWQGPTTTRAPIARGSIADDKAHNWNASYPSVRFDDAAVAGTRKGDILTRKLDGATYRIERMVPDGFGRTTAQLTARQRTTN